MKIQVNTKLIENAGEHNGRSGDCAGRPLLPPSGSSPPARPGKGQPTLRTLSTLKKKGFRFTLTTDEYTSMKNRRYINVNCHVKDDFFSLN